MKILVLSKYSRLGASSRLRTLQFIPYIEAHGHEVTIKCLFDDSYLNNLYSTGKRSLLTTSKMYIKRLISLLDIKNHDVIWIEKEIFPYAPALVERLLNISKIPYIVDYDDAIFHNYDLSSNYLIRKLLGKKIDTVMRNASCVITGNAYLASRAIRAGSLNTLTIPTVVDNDRYKPHSERLSQALTIGWIGSPSTQKYIIDIHEALLNISKNFDFQLILMGATPSVTSKLPGLNVKVLPWSENSEAEFIRFLDIGIMPLTDGPWEKGKCGYKLIQYMACSVPVVASPVGVNISIVSDNKCGLLAADVKDWELKLSTLLASKELRAALGKAGRNAIDNVYSVAVQAPRILAALKSVANPDPLTANKTWFFKKPNKNNHDPE